jgi:hypothetical protein
VRPSPIGKRLHFNHGARQLLHAGVDELANTVKVTLGTKGATRSRSRGTPATAAALVAQGLGTDHGDFDLAAVEQVAAEGRAGGRLGRNPLGRAAR